MIDRVFSDLFIAEGAWLGTVCRTTLDVAGMNAKSAFTDNLWNLAEIYMMEAHADAQIAFDETNALNSCLSMTSTIAKAASTDPPGLFRYIGILP
jgi:hypothetical protein